MLVEQCVALYQYLSTEPGDLSFNQGDVIIVLKADGEWWTGTKDGQTGIFPANFVKKMETTSKVYIVFSPQLMTECTSM